MNYGVSFIIKGRTEAETIKYVEQCAQLFLATFPESDLLISTIHPVTDDLGQRNDVATNT